MNSFFRVAFLFFLIVFLFGISVYAHEATVVSLPELGMTVSMPDDYVVFTREINACDPNLSKYGLTKTGLSTLMNERSIYLNGWDENLNQEIVITMIDSNLRDFNLYSDTVLATMASTFETEYKSVEMSLVKYEIYQHTQAKFLKIYISQLNEDAVVYGLQYYTVYNEKAISITIQSYSGQITADQEKIIKSVVDSAVFDSEPQIVEHEQTSTNAFLYVDPKTKAIFTVPANWQEEALLKERKYIDAKFVSNEEDGLAILYGCSDVYELMPELAEEGVPRSAVNSEMFTSTFSTREIDEVFEELYENTGDGVHVCKFGENKFFVADATSSAEIDGVTCKLPIILALGVDNGYFYSFLFYGSRDNEQYRDFEDLLTSVDFGSGYFGWRGRFSTQNILMSLLITIIIYSIPIILYRYIILKAPIDSKKAKKITIIYGICAFLVMSAIIYAVNGNGAAGGAIIFWSWINYRVLIGGKKRRANVLDSTKTNINNADATRNDDMTVSLTRDAVYRIPIERALVQNKTVVKYCNNCGNSILADSLYCNKCGLKIILKEENGQEYNHN